MALSRKGLREALQNAGVSEDNMDGLMKFILDGHTASLDALKEQIDNLNGDLSAANTKVASYTQMETDNTNLKKEIDDLKKASDKAAKIQSDFDAYKADVEKRDTNRNKDTAMRKSFRAAGVQSDDLLDLLMGKVDIEQIEMDGDSIKNSESIINPMKEKYSGLFSTQSNRGTAPVNPPSGSTGLTKEQFAKMGYAERAKLYKENPETYKQMTGKE